MTREDLIKQLVDKQPHMTHKVMSKAVVTLLHTMMQGLREGSRIEIRGFGSFSRRTKLPRLARNPKTGAVLHTEEKFSVHFKSGKDLKERVNSVQTD